MVIDKDLFAEAPMPSSKAPSFNAFIENIAGNVTAAAAEDTVNNADNGNPWNGNWPPQNPVASSSNSTNPFL